MRINIPSTKAALSEQNRRLRDAIDGITRLRDKLDFNSAALCGKGYGAMHRYNQGELLPLTRTLISALSAQIAANNAYRAAINRYLPQVKLIDTDALIRQREEVEHKINKLLGARDFYSSFPDPFGVAASIDRQIEPLARTRDQLADAFSKCMDFLAATQSTYVHAEALKRFVRNRLASAQAGWSPSNGFSKQYKTEPVSPGVPATMYAPDHMTPCLIEVDGYGNFLVPTSNGKAIYAYNEYKGEGSPANEVSCTYYTLRRLRERGIEFPFAPGASDLNGYNWINSCSDDLNDHKAFGGSNDVIFRTLLDKHGAHLTNIVVSFPATAANYGYGHVILIDKLEMINGVIHVTFSDMVDHATGAKLINCADSSPTRTVTLDQFTAWYGQAIGAVHLGGQI